MVLIGLLLVAVVCLALGLVLASPGWLVGSLAASAAAAWVLWRGRDSVAPAPGAPAVPSTGPDGDGAAAGENEAVALAQPDYARRRADALGAAAGSSAVPRDSDVAAVALVATPPPVEAGTEVWVIDGRPHYHSSGCQALLAGEPEAIPLGQAVEDGFTPCPLCGTAPGTDGAGESTVWVIDGWPHYHARECAVLASSGQPEPVPFAQAVADGFTPCPACRAAAEPGPEPVPPASPLAEVWVVPGRPRYHQAGCMIIGEQGAVARTLSDARSEGFKPCSLCDPPV